MSTDSEHDDLAQDLHAMRAEPRQEFARELDTRAAGWLRERPKRRLPSLRMAIPAVAAATAAAVVVAIVVSGGDDGNGGGGADRLEVAVVSEGAPQSGGFAAPQTGGGVPGTAAPEESLQAPLQRDAPAASGGAFLLPSTEDGTTTVRYVFPAQTEATVQLAGREAEVTLEAGSGSLEISTEGLPPGAHDLTITTPTAPTYRERIQIGR